MSEKWTRRSEPKMTNKAMPGKAFMLCILALGVVFVAPAAAAEDPDELYRKGRFEEAGKIYTREDMDHPKDLRYRYNRGCASFQKGDFQGAMAAFSSVLRRAEDNETRLKAAYNLGNAAFKQGNAASAAAYYKQVLTLDPDNENARYNLELALRKLKEEEDKKKEKQSTDGEQKDADDSGKEDQKEGKDNQSPSQKPQETEKDTEKQMDKKDSEPKPSKEQKEQNKGRETGKDQKQDGEKSPPQDLSGDLKPREAPAPRKEETGSPEQASVQQMDRQKAEALLDNVKEDRSRFLELQALERKRLGASSGKDW